MTKILLPLVMLVFVSRAGAQQAVTNNGNLRIHPGAAISISGHFTNGGPAALINNGALYAKNGITNNQALMTAGSGTLYVNGSAAQALGGSQPMKVFNLVTSNAAGLTLNNDLSISGTHTYSAGMITTSASNALCYESGASYTGSSDARHVNGLVRKTGATDFIFPVGNASYLRSISLVNLSASAVFDVRHLPNTPYTNQVEPLLVSVDQAEHWSISSSSGASARIGMNWDNSKVAFPYWTTSSIHAARYNGSKWVSEEGIASGNAATTGSLTSQTTSTFGLFTFGSTTYTVPLTLVSFTGRRLSGQTELSWKTAQEQHLSHFIVERSQNGRDFYFVARVAARNSSGTSLYACTDQQPISNRAWYRLRCVDMDGREKLSAMVMVTEASLQEISLLENPVRSSIRLLPAGVRGQFSFQVHTADGQLVQQGSIDLQAAVTYELPLKTGMQPGNYTLRLLNDQSVFTLRFIKQ